MGMMGAILGAGGAARNLGAAVGGIAEVFVGNAAEREAARSREALAAVAELGVEFSREPVGRFDGFVDGLNRLPRPLLTLGTLGLFVYAMAAPRGFTVRMHGLDAVPEPLWWLLGAIVSFYFGARELHHRRTRSTVKAARTLVRDVANPAAGTAQPARNGDRIAVADIDPDRNAAVEDWRRTLRR